MNKTFFLPVTGPALLLLCASLQGCEDENSAVDNQWQRDPTSPYTVGKTTAANDALTAAKQFFANDTANTSAREIESVGALTSGAGANDTLAYVCNFKHDAGFAIIAADSRVKDRVIACTDQGRFDENTDNPGMSLFIDNIKAYAERKIAENKGRTVKAYGLKNATDSIIYQPAEQVDPLIKTAWSQDYPYNAFIDTCPQSGMPYYTGCTATAIVQLMAYYNCPGLGFIDQLTAKKHAEELDDFARGWVGIYFRSFWHWVPKKYDKCGTGIYVEDALDYLADYGHQTSGRVRYANSTILKNVGEQHPVIVSGQGNTGGHTWLMDGYRIEHYSYASDPTNEMEGDTYFHINWGWGGDCDGWFAAGCFDVDAAKEFDQYHFYYGRNYTYELYTYLTWPKVQEETPQLDVKELENEILQ